MDKKHVNLRLDGLDLARFIAFFGMVIVNFKVVLGVDDNGSLLSLFTDMLVGKAAATFVVLAGIGLGLAAIRREYKKTALVTLKRAGFLLVLGLINMLIFEGDILHYYAFYFLFGILFLPLQTRWLIMGIVLLNIAFLVMVLFFNYDAGWDWINFDYVGFWTGEGFIRNLFFNGWHPVIPWLSFFLFGIILSRIPLSKPTIQNRLIFCGLGIYIVAVIASKLLTNLFLPIDPELVYLVTTEPLPPTSIFILTGIGCASFMTGICLRFSGWFDRVGLLNLIIPAGRQTLTLYVFHIVIGMGTLEALGLIGNQSLSVAVSSALLFCLIAVVYAFTWSKIFKRGPIESLMRNLAG